MKRKYLFHGFVGAFFLCLISAPSLALTSRQIDEIERVRSKSVLDDEDFQIIDNFLEEATAELLGMENFSNVWEVRTQILSCTRSKKDSAQTQYQEAFFNSAYKHITSALDKSSNIPSEERRFKVTSNILILLKELLAENERQARLVKLAVKFINTDNEVVRYWAIRCVTSPEIRPWLTSAGNSKTLQQILNQMEKVIDKARPETIKLIARFVAQIETENSKKVLMQIADMRIKKYEDWSVRHELLDIVVLKSIYKKLADNYDNKPDLARRFAQLYSYALQRYIRDLKGGNFLKKDAKNQLISVLVEIESKCIGPLLGTKAESIRSAIEKDDPMKLMAEHDRILGDESKKGLLAQKLGYNYGEKTGRENPTDPLELPQRTKAAAS